jgi:CheY-like chemotaxis protein
MPWDGRVACTGGYVLVVDDDADIRGALAEILAADYGHNIKTASDGREALDVIGGGPPPSLVLVDLMMPRMNGRAFIAHANGQPTLSSIPFCLMTASSRWDPEVARVASIVARDFPVLRKPFDMHELMSIVERYC